MSDFHREDCSILEKLFGRPKPVIAMMHLLPLPGRPLYDSHGGMAAVVAALRRGLDILQEGGVGGLFFCKESGPPSPPPAHRRPRWATGAAHLSIPPHIPL